MHNAPNKNLEFQIAFTETNIRYLLGPTPQNDKLIKKHRATVAKCKAKLAKLKP